MARRGKTVEQAATAAGWRNRIVRTGMVPAGQFLANEENWRVHPVEQQEALQTLIGYELGWLQTVLVNLRGAAAWGQKRNAETVIDGHARIELALRKGEDTLVPTSWVDLTPPEEKLALAVFDPVGAMAYADGEKLRALAASLPETRVDLARVLPDIPAPSATADLAPAMRFSVLVECPDEPRQQALLQRLQKEGWKARGMASR